MKIIYKIIGMPIFVHSICSERMKRTIKAKNAYGHIYYKVKQNATIQQKRIAAGIGGPADAGHLGSSAAVADVGAGALMPYEKNSHASQEYAVSEIAQPSHQNASSQVQLIPKKAPTIPKPKWHAPWKLYRVISGHLGWVRCAAVEPGNEWFVTGAADRVIKVWDLASGKLKLSLTGMTNIRYTICK